MFHGVARQSTNRFETKGTNPLSESYSALQEEVVTTWDGGRLPGLESHYALLARLIESEAVLIAGLASSHCVRETVSDLIRTDPALAPKLFILEDCTAPVVVPGHDFTEETKRAFAEFQALGVHVVSSKDIHDLEEFHQA